MLIDRVSNAAYSGDRKGTQAMTGFRSASVADETGDRSVGDAEDATARTMNQPSETVPSSSSSLNVNTPSTTRVSTFLS
jgi:hypothetical protein